MFKYYSNIYNEVQDIVFDSIKSVYPDLILSVQSIKIEIPKSASHGDLSTNIAFIISKDLKLNPMTCAESLRVKLIEINDIFDSVEVLAPGFINFKFTNAYLLKNAQQMSKSSLAQQVYLDKKFLIEHTSPNPNKALHLGHLKNNVTGIAISNLIENAGAKVVKDCINNNRGIAIARLMWGYLKFARKNEETPVNIEFWASYKGGWYTPLEAGKSESIFIDELYTKGSQDCQENPDSEQVVRAFVIEWEKGNEFHLELWKLTQDWVWAGFRKSLKRVDGWQFDHIWNEHEIYMKGKEHVETGVKRGFFKRLEDGAVVTDLKKDFGLTDTILIKNDGTALYITQDLELTRLKREKFDPDYMIWIIGPEQSLQMKQMFAVCSQLGFGEYENFLHLPYGFVLVRNSGGDAQKMSSREGTQIYSDQLIDLAKSKILDEIKPESFTEEEKEAVAETLAISAIKYSLLKVSRTQDMVFDLNSSVALEGDSAPYIQYTQARAKSVLRSSGIVTGELSFQNMHTNHKLETVERELLFILSYAAEVLADAAINMAPNTVCNYIFELSQSFNRFYTSCPINTVEGEVKNFRVKLTAQFIHTTNHCMKLLGINPVEKM